MICSFLCHLQEKLMTSAAQAAANRRNSQKSTGPKTEEGKAASAMNALKHGMCAQTPLLPGEDAEAFGDIRADLHARYRPQGRLEARLVDRMAVLAWRLQRAEWAEMSMLLAEPADASAAGEGPVPADGFDALAARLAAPFTVSGTGGLERLARYERQIEQSLARAEKQFASFSANRCEFDRHADAEEREARRAFESQLAYKRMRDRALHERERRERGRADADAPLAGGRTDDPAPAVRDAGGPGEAGPDRQQARENGFVSPPAEIAGAAPEAAPETSRETAPEKHPAGRPGDKTGAVSPQREYPGGDRVVEWVSVPERTGPFFANTNFNPLTAF
jgi:hypothetical protein